MTADDELSGQHLVSICFSASLLTSSSLHSTAWMLAELSLCNGKKLHDLWLRGAMTASMAIFDLTFIGRVMNRLSKDWTVPLLAYSSACRLFFFSPTDIIGLCFTIEISLSLLHW